MADISARYRELLAINGSSSRERGRIEDVQPSSSRPPGSAAGSPISPNKRRIERKIKLVIVRKIHRKCSVGRL